MRIGERVRWISQAKGSWAEKFGTVLAEIPAGESARQHIPADAKKSHIKFDKDISMIPRVLVAVPAGKDGSIIHYYCPGRSVLKA